MTELQARLIGRSEFRVDGQRLPAWPRPSARRLITLLVVAPGARRTRDELADALFPHLPPDRAARSISRALSLARSVMPRDLLAADGTNIWIAEDVEVTTDLDDPVELASGRLPLADDPYEDWAIEVRDDVQRRQFAALLDRARSTAANDDWQRVADLDPSSEEACLGVAVSAAEQGDTDGVVAAFERHVAAVVELGLQPRPVLRQHIQQLTERAAAIATRWDAAEPDAAPPLRGRDEAIERIVQTLAGRDPRKAVPGTQVLIGPAGIGKSSLARVAAARLQSQGWRVGHGRASPEDHLAPMAALRSALRALLPEHDDPLHGPGGDRPDGDAEPGDVAQLADDVDAALGGLPGPALLVLDDLQWADAALQRLAARLAVRPDRGWALLLAVRSDEPGSPVPDLPSDVPHLELLPLEREAATALVRAELPDAEDVRIETIVQRGAGNPFFLLELARAEDDGDDPDLGTVPARVVALLRRRLAPVSVPARRLLEYVAVLGDAASEDLAHAHVDLGDDGALLDELVDAALLRTERTTVTLAHPLLRDAVLGEINPIRRATLHSRVADVQEQLAARPGRDRDNRMLQGARHRLAAFQLGGRTVEDALLTARSAFDAAQLAHRMFASEVTEELGIGGLVAFESLDGPARGELAGRASETLRALGHVRLSQGDRAAAEDAYRQALGLAPDALSRARCWRALAWIPYRAGDIEGTVAVCEQGLAAISDDPLAAALLGVELGWCLQRSGRAAEALPALEDAAQVAEESADWDLAARALDRLGVVLGGLDREEEGLATLERAAAAAARTGKQLVRAGIGIHRAAALSSLQRHAEAITVIEEAAELAERIGDAYLRSVAHWVAAEVHEAADDLEAALAERTAEIRLLRTIDNARHLCAALAHQALLLAAAGRDDEAAVAADSARTEARRAGPGRLAAIESRLGALAAEPLAGR